MTVLMANCVGRSGDMECAGKSSVWNKQGVLIEQLEDAGEGLIVFDMETQKVLMSRVLA